MLTYSIRDIVLCTTELERDEHYLYVVQDEDGLPLYVGQADDPVSRLLEHLGMAGDRTCSSLGRLVREHWPASFSWTVILLTIEDCEPHVVHHYPSLFAGWDSLERYYDPRLLEYAITLAEQALLAELRPCLNVGGHASPRQLPEKYQDGASAPW